MTTADPNRVQIDYWNDQTGPKWVEQQAELDRLLSALGLAAMERLSLRPGMRVLDVGCGCGDTTLALADRVGASGSVLGVDVSGPMLARARERAAGHPHVAFLQADAQTHRFEPATFDAAFSRFGVMFFADPAVAFANIRAALRPGAALAFICWQELAKNPWAMLPIGAIAPLVTLPPPPAPDEPGPFSFADPDRVRSILDGAGFTGVHADGFAPSMTLGAGGSLDDAVRFAIEAGPAARFLRDAPADVLAQARAAVRQALAPHATAGGVQLPGACWLVTARNA
jgi:SAM-dependent methyltransferase